MQSFFFSSRIHSQLPIKMKNQHGINFNRLDRGSKQKRKILAEEKYYTNECQYWTGCQSKSIYRLNVTNNVLMNFSFVFIYRYSSEDAVGDLVAGITVGLTVIPQALAYSGIAGLAPAVSAFITFIQNRPLDLLF